MDLLRRKTAASEADRHHLYQESVQDVETEIDFVEKTWQELRNRPAELLREDFCGTANTACEWVRRDPQHYALAIDFDPEVLEWGRLNNLAQLDDEQYERIVLLQNNVLDAQPELADIILAMNFSYFLFLERAELLEYFKCARAGLASDGILFLDAYGGYDAPKVLQEERRVRRFYLHLGPGNIQPDRLTDGLSHSFRVRRRVPHRQCLLLSLALVDAARNP